MRSIISAMNVRDDLYTRRSFNKDDFGEQIRSYNTGGSAIMHIFNPYDNKDKSFLDADRYYFYLQGFELNGLFGYGTPNGRSTSLGHTSQMVDINLMLNPATMPMLSMDTLMSCLPHITWDEFGNHLVLEDRDALLVENLWNLFLEQNRAFFNAVNSLNYPLPGDRSRLCNIFNRSE